MSEIESEVEDKPDAHRLLAPLHSLYLFRTFLFVFTPSNFDGTSQVNRGCLPYSRPQRPQNSSPDRTRGGVENSTPHYDRPDVQNTFGPLDAAELFRVVVLLGIVGEIIWFWKGE